MSNLASDTNKTRRRNRSSRRQGQSGGYRPRSSKNGGRYRTEKEKPKKSLWAKILSFFSGDGSKPAGNSPKTSKASGVSAASSAQKQIKRGSQALAVEVTSPRLYVGNLSYDATESDLFDLFNTVGKVQNAEIVAHKQSQKSKGFGFVVMQSLDEAKRAVDVLHDKEFLGRKLIVSGAKEKSSP